MSEDSVRSHDAVNRLRRHLSMRLDQAWTLARWRLSSPPRVPPFDGNPRFALLTVNFATTRYLKLMLLTLSEQRSLDRIEWIVVVDNLVGAVREPFLPLLAERVERLHLVENRWFANHARGMRAGIRTLADVECEQPEGARANLLLFCDPDVVFRNPATIDEIASVVVQRNAALVGELRGDGTDPDIQASFFAVRRDAYARRSVVPWVHHGSPALWMQRSIARNGLAVADFRGNSGGYILHRGRTAVAATRGVAPRHPYATVGYREPHFMGVPDGPHIWAEIERRHDPLLSPEAEGELLEILGERLAGLGRTSPADT